MSMDRRSNPYPASILLLLVCMVLPTTGCQSNDQQKVELQSQLDSLSSQCTSVRQAVADQQSTLEALNQRLNQERAQLQEYNAGVQSYMLQHKMAVAALLAGVAGTVPWMNGNDTYSEDAKEVGAAITAIAVIWAISNMDEVSEVLSTLNQADAHVHSLQAQIDQTSSAIGQEQAGIRQTQERLGMLSQKTAAVQQQLSQL